MASTSPVTTSKYTGLGQNGNWSDPANWAGGVPAANTNSIALFQMGATLNTSFTAGSFMAFGNEAITINGTLNTLSTNICTNMMVCDYATATFSPTSTLNAAGGMVVGVDSVGTLVANGNATSHATLNTVVGKMGLYAGSSGSIAINGAVWNDTQGIWVGSAGNGNLTVTNGGQVHTGTDFIIGAHAGSTGQVTVSSGGTITSGGHAILGGAPELGAGAGGRGHVTVASGGVFTSEQSFEVGLGSSVTLAGGSIVVKDSAPGLKLQAGATLSGNGTVTALPSSAGTGGIWDDGTIQASGGTLTLNGQVGGAGQAQIASGSTLAINSDHISLQTIAFTGTNETLSLSHGLFATTTITGFSTGDTILASGIDHMNWNANTDTLKLFTGTQIEETLHFTGAYASNAFTMTNTSAGAVITGHLTTLGH